MLGHSALSETPISALSSAETVVAEAAASASGASTPVAAAAAAASAQAEAAGTSTPTASGASLATAHASASGVGTAAASTAAPIIASAAVSAEGASTAIAIAEGSGLAIPDFTPVGGGGGFGPPGHRYDKPRFRTRKDKSHPKVITVRIGDWPEDPQIILERQEKAEREDFHRRLANRPDDIVVESVDEDEQALLEILAFAA